MSEKSEALRLADALDAWDGTLMMPAGWRQRTSAELRRLHDEVESLRQAYNIVTDDCRNLTEKVIPNIRAQRDALKQTLHDELGVNLRLRDLGGARPDEPMLTFLERIIAERDALLRALKSTGLFLHHCWRDVQMNDYSFEKLNRQMEIVDAAIKMVEEGK